VFRRFEIGVQSSSVFTSLGQRRSTAALQNASETMSIFKHSGGVVARLTNAITLSRMKAYPKSPKEMTAGMLYFPRMLDKIRLHARGELTEDYHARLGGPRTADGLCTNFLRVRYDELRNRVLAGGSDEEILEWCYENGRRLNAGDIRVWNGFISKLGWNDFASSLLEEEKQRHGIGHRTDIVTIPDLIDLDEARRS